MMTNFNAGFVRVPDVLFGWRRDEIILWGEKRFSDSKTEAANSFRMTAYYKEIYCSICDRVRQGLSVEKTISRFPREEFVDDYDCYFSDDEKDKTEAEDLFDHLPPGIFTESPPAETYTRPAPFNKAIESELIKRDQYFKSRLSSDDRSVILQMLRNSDE